MRVNLGNWNPGTGAPTFNGASIVYATYATTTTVGGTTLTVAPRTVYITAATSAPKWLSDLLKTTVGPMVVQGEIDLATRQLRRADLDRPAEQPGAVLGQQRQGDTQGFPRCRSA